jgi:hypothetical protein
MGRRGRKLFATQFLGNLLVLGLGYYWLGVSESRAATLAWSALLALLILCLACCLHGGLQVFFRGSDPPVRTILRHLAPFVAAAILAGAVYWSLAQWAEYSGTPALRIASWCTLKLREPVKPAAVLRVFDFVLMLVRWMVIPVYVLPMFSGIAVRGWRGFSEFGRLRRSHFYWLAAPLLLVCALAVPRALIAWVPLTSSFAVEMASLVVRWTVAYFLFLCSWIFLASLTSAGKPAPTQFKTAASP